MRIYYLIFLGLCLSIGLHAQSVVTGKVTLANTNEEAIGASVQLKGTTVGATTDLSGDYKLNVPDKKSGILVISYTGFVTQEVAIGGRNEVNVILAESASTLNEVVVTGYGSQKRSNISGSVSSLDATKIAERPIMRVEQALQGQTAGVQVAQNSGSPGSAISVRIRGSGSLGSSEPLYIVDGIPVDGLDFLNTNDIETINVLKDAASAAIYGSRGANGVVLITTKGGKRNQDGRVSYEMYYGTQRAGRLLELLNATEYAMLQNEAYIAAGQVPRPELAYPEALGEGTDWQEAIFAPAPIMSQQLSFSGGSDRSAYTVSGNYFTQGGIVGGDKSKFERATARLNGNYDVKKWMTVGTNVAYTWLTRSALVENSQYNSPVIRAINMDPVTPIRKADGSYAYSNYATTDIANPVNAIEQTHGDWTTNRVVGSVFMELKLLKNLTFRSAGSLDATFAVQRGFNPRYNLSNIPGFDDAPTPEINRINGVGVSNFDYTTKQWENVLTFSPSIGENHGLTLIAGTTALSKRAEGNGGGNTNLPSNDPDDAYIGNTIDPIENQTSFGWASESSLLSWFGKANYTLNDKYLFSGTLRADGSSRFGKNNRWGYFPSVSAGWVASRENFWNLSAINFFKVRASWGQNGNDQIGDYSFSTLVFNGQNYTFGPGETITNGAVALVAPNPDLKWETSTQSNIGFDAGLFNNRVEFTADYYIKETSDMLYAAPIPLVGGTAAPVQNVATAENRGLELSASYRNYDRAFKYSVGGNIAFVKSKVTGLGIGGEPILSGLVQSANANSSRTDVGHPLASFYGYVTDGIFQTEEEVEAGAFQSDGTAPGDIRFKDLDKNGVIDINDRTYIGNPTPDFTYGFNTDFEYKNIGLTVFFQGTKGNDIYVNTTRYDFNFVNRPASALNRWTGPGTSNSEPRVSLNDLNQNARISDRFVEDGSYLRLKNVQLSYNLPTTWLSKAKFQKMKVYVSAQNLLTFTNYSGLDPEIGAVAGSLELGIDRGFYPQARTIMGGVNITF